jgi:hypothetical protein
MGIQIEFNTDLCLRNISEFKEGRRKKEECTPEKLEAGKVYEFLKKGQRIFWFNDTDFWSKGEFPLCETNGNEEISRPIASIRMIEVTHFMENGEVFTKGKYNVVEVFDPDNPKIQFESCRRIK